MDFSKISYTEVTENANNLRETATSMEEVLNNIKNEFNKVGAEGNEVWTGTAASEAKANFDQLSAKFADFSLAVNECAAYLDQVVANFQAVESKISGQ